MARRLVCLLAAVAVTGCSGVTGGSAAPGADATAGGRTISAAPSPPSTPATSSPPPQGPVTLSFAGDVHTAGRLTERFQQPETALAPVAPLLGRADLTVVNLETAVTDRGTAEDKSFTFRAPPSTSSPWPTTTASTSARWGSPTAWTPPGSGASRWSGSVRTTPLPSRRTW